MGTILFECPKTGSAVSTGAKPSPSACRLLKHGWSYIARSVGISMERRYGLLRKRRLPRASARALPCEKTRR